MNKLDISNLEKISKNARLSVLKMVTRANSSHIGSAYSIIDILTVLYSHFVNKKNKFILSKGHAATGLYAVLAEYKLIKKSYLKTYASNGSLLTGHISHKVPHIHLSTGSLGHGLPVGCGMAFANKLDKSNSKVYVLIGDGEQNEGSIWEAAMFASHHQLDNLIVIVDQNNWQGLGRPNEIMKIDSIIKAWESMGWECKEVDGHSFEEMFKVFSDIVKNGKPKVVFAKTIKGKGVSFMEDTLLWHYRSPRGDEYDMAFEELSN